MTTRNMANQTNITKTFLDQFISINQRIETLVQHKQHFESMITDNVLVAQSTQEALEVGYKYADKQPMTHNG